MTNQIGALFLGGRSNYAMCKYFMFKNLHKVSTFCSYRYNFHTLCFRFFVYVFLSGTCGIALRASLLAETFLFGICSTESN